MKIRHPVFIKLTALLLSWAFRFWLGSISYRTMTDAVGLAPKTNKRRSIYIFWHEMMLVPAYHYANPYTAVLVSHHADGELISRIVQMLGGRTVRGSTKKRGMTALRVMMRQENTRHLAITPDGPRGPRRTVQAGAIYLASRNGMPVIPAGFAYRRCHRNRSWDKMAIPYPGVMAQEVIGLPIDIPAELDREGIEHYRLIVQSAIDDVQERAEKRVLQDIE